MTSGREWLPDFLACMQNIPLVSGMSGEDKERVLLYEP